MSVMYHMTLHPPLLKRDFWLYVWKVGLPDGRFTHYVGMTGDVTGVAGSAFGRLSTHVGKNGTNNALRRNLRRGGLDVEDCLSLDFYAYGPIYSVPENSQLENRAIYESLRRRVAALEKRLWYRMRLGGYKMLNSQPGATALVDGTKWKRACTEFQKYFPNLKSQLDDAPTAHL